MAGAALWPLTNPTLGERVEWAGVAGLVQELLDNRGVDHAFPLGDPSERVHENGGVGDALFA